MTESSRQQIVDFLCDSGGWTLLNQRPFDILPDPTVVPRDIFISTFSSAPLAPDGNIIVKGKEDLFQKGIDTLARLTKGHVHLGLDASGKQAPSAAFTEAGNCQKYWFSGKHPRGNVGIQIHHIAPINPGHIVWTLGVQEVIVLGELMFKGIFNTERLVALTGAFCTKPGYYKTFQGANIPELTADLIEGNIRLIDGDVLSGTQVKDDQFQGNNSNHLTAIEEGDYYETFGWLLPLKPRPTISKTLGFIGMIVRVLNPAYPEGWMLAIIFMNTFAPLLDRLVIDSHISKRLARA